MDHKRQPINVIYLSTYVPQKCGIATFTKDVTTAINLLNPHALAEIMAVVKPGEDPDFPWEVKYKIRQQDPQTYLNAAKYINNSSVDVLLVEHEFGIYGGDHGDYLVSLLKEINKPKVLTCHTIINDPNNDWGKSFKKLLPHTDAYIVMTQNSAEELRRLYKIPLRKIFVVPHGTPDIPLTPTEIAKSKRRLQNRIIMGNINLLSENKGLDYNLEAVAKIAKVYPQILYLIIGQTHPNILEKDGEKYRNSLKKKIRQLNIQKNVRFINRYVSLEELVNWLKIIDYYVTPYLDSQQSSSGALAYALGAGKICISTPYIYAKEVLAENRGILVPFYNSDAIADTIIKLEKNPIRKSEIQHKAYEYGRFMTWSNVALQHLDLFSHLIKKHVRKSSITN